MLDLSRGAVPVSRIPNDVRVGSPEWWVYKLDEEMVLRQRLIDLQEDYYAGRHALNFATSSYRETYAEMLAAVNDNWVPLIVQMAVERQVVQGFSFGEEADEQGDREALDIWQRNYLDAESPLLLTEAAKHGESYLLVWPEMRTSPGVFGRYFRRRSQIEPRITVEHPSQMIVRREAGDRRRRAAALKKWQEDDGSIVATLYLPDSIHYFQQFDYEWKPRDGRVAGRNEFGVVPVIPVVNDPQMLPCKPPTALTCHPHRIPDGAHVGLGRSDIVDIVSTIDQINKLACDMLVASEFAAFRQRWITGLDIPDDEDGGEQVEEFKAAIDRVWALPRNEHGDEVKVGEFGATDLKNYTNAIESRVQSLAARTRTPPHYLLGGIANISGEALQAAETSLASKADGKNRHAGEGLEEAIRLAFAIKGDMKRATNRASEVIWAPTEKRNEALYADSLIKKMALGVPKEQLWQDAGYSPQQIRKFKRMLLMEGLMNPPEEPTVDEEPAEPDAAAA